MLHFPSTRPTWGWQLLELALIWVAWRVGTHGGCHPHLLLMHLAVPGARRKSGELEGAVGLRGLVSCQQSEVEWVILPEGTVAGTARAGL